MFQGKYIFSQIMEFVTHYDLGKCINRYFGNKHIRSLDCRDQFLALAFGQLSNLRSLRGIVVCLNAHSDLLYHLGFKSRSLSLSTLSRANEKRDWKIYRDLAQILVEKARQLYINDNDFVTDLNGAVYLLDSTVVTLCLSVFGWADFEPKFAGIKIHTQLDLKGNIPSFFLITNAKISDRVLLDALEFETGAFYVMDRGYFDFKRLYDIDRASAFFVIRPFSNVSWQRMYSNKVNEADRKNGVLCDQIIKLNTNHACKRYPNKLRRIKYLDKESKRRYVYFTNNFQIDAKKVACLYKNRWQIELFFRWIKQHLEIQVFWGHSANAVKTQICIALCTFLIVAIMKKELNIDRNLYEILQILSVSQFEKTPINTLLSEFNINHINHNGQERLFLLDY